MKTMRHNLITALTAAVACFLLVPTAAADQVIADDLIVDGSACIGLDCLNNENFGFETIRLKENNLRIKAEDTSAGAFPSNDWQLTFNDSASGGQNKFSVEDITGARVPFTIEAGAPNNSLYVDSTHRVGFGTSTPVLDLHVNTSNTPGLRLEQNSSGGFSAQTWDVAGNEANFFVRDVTGGSRLPFRIRPGAPTSSVDIGATGNVGIGTASPGAPLHVRRTNGSAKILVDEASGTVQARAMLELMNQGNPLMDFENASTGNQWQIGMNASDNFVIDSPATATGDNLTINRTNGNLTVLGSLFSSGGTCGGGCDYVFNPAYDLESIEEHAAFMWENSHLEGVGPTEENQPRLNVTEKVGGLINELEKAHIYIDRLNEKLKEKEVRMDELTARLARLEAQFAVR